MKKRTTVAAFPALVLLALVAGCGGPREGAPDFRASLLASDEPVSLENVRGHVVLLTNWAVWCTECRDELPQLEQFWKERGENVQVIAVNVDSTSGPAQRMAKQFGLTMPVWHATQSSFERAFGTFGVPSSALLSASGTIVKTFIGPIDFQGQEFLDALASQAVEGGS